MALQQANVQKTSVKTLRWVSKSLFISSKGVGSERIAQELYKIYSSSKKVKYKALKYRKQFLWDKALALETEDGTKACKQVRRILSIEE